VASKTQKKMEEKNVSFSKEVEGWGWEVRMRIMLTDAEVYVWIEWFLYFSSTGAGY
jgi:hypothetical protein